MSQNRPSQNQVADFQKLLASGTSSEAKALAHALNTQKGGLGSWGPKTKAAFAVACETAGVSPESIDFDNPKDPELLKLMGSLRSNTAARAEDVHSSLGDLLSGMENQRPFHLTNGLEIHPNELRTTDQLIDEYVKLRAELSGRSEIEIRRQLDGDDNWHISRDELIKDFNERAPRRVWHSEQNARVGVLVNDEDVVANPDNPFAQYDKIDSIGGIMSQLSKRLGMEYDGKEYTIQRVDTWLPAGLGEGVSIPPTPKNDDPRMQPIRGASFNSDRDSDNLGDGGFTQEGKNLKLDALLKDYDFQVKDSFSFKNTSENERDTISNIKSVLSTSKANGIA